MLWLDVPTRTNGSSLTVVSHTALPRPSLSAPWSHTPRRRGRQRSRWPADRRRPECTTSWRGRRKLLWQCSRDRNTPAPRRRRAARTTAARTRTVSHPWWSLWPSRSSRQNWERNRLDRKNTLTNSSEIEASLCHDEKWGSQMCSSGALVQHWEAETRSLSLISASAHKD